MSRIVSEGLIGRKWIMDIHNKMTVQLCGASLGLQFAARWQAGVAGIVTSCFGHSNVLAPQIQKLAQIKKHTFLFISSQCVSADKFTAAIFFAHMQSICSRNLVPGLSTFPLSNLQKCRTVPLGSTLGVSSCV